MKFNFKKIATVLGSTLMLGSTVALAAAANYPAPFVNGGAANVAVVVGANAPADILAAANIQANLASALSPTASSSTGASVSGGDSIDLATSSTNLYYNSSLNAGKSTITKNEMPTLLADSSVTDDSGTEYSYTQSVKVGDSLVDYSTSGSDFDDPALIIAGGSSAADPLYNYTITFNKALNITNSNVQGNDIEILGQKYTIGSQSDGSASPASLYLFGSGQSVTLNEGDEQTVTINGKDYDVKLVGIDSNGAASLTVNGGSIKQISDGSSSNLNGLNIYVKNSFYSAKTSSTNYATLNLGTNQLLLQNGQAVEVGTDNTPIQNTLVTFGLSGDALSSLTVSVAMQDSTKDYIKAGESFTDPVFGGLKLSFADVNPALDSTSRESVVVDTDNSRNVRVKFTSDVAGTEKQISFLHDQDNSDSTTAPILADSGNKTIHDVEGENVGINEYMVINAGDKGRIIKATSIPNGIPSSSSSIQFQDVFTGDNIFSTPLTVGTSLHATTNIDGQPYYFDVNNDTQTVNVTWGSGATYGYEGDAITVSPRIKTQNGGWVSILAPVTLTNSTKYSLPGLDTLSSYETGQVAGFNNLSTTEGMVFGNVNYTVTDIATSASNVTTGTLSGIASADASTDCNFNATYGGAILFQEEKKVTESGNSNNGDIICVAADQSGSTTPVELSVATPVVTNVWSGLQSWTSDSNTQTAVTRYGTYITYNSQDNDMVTISYPNDQMVADVLFAADSATVTAGSSSGGNAGSDLGYVLVKDSELGSSSSKNLIVVGGSCVNTVAATLLGSSTPLCGADFTAKTGVGDGQYLIQSFDNPDATGKVAMLVAGYNAADTSKAVTDLVNNADTFDTSVGKKYTGTSTTVATAVTTSSTDTNASMSDTNSTNSTA
jgi:hypothetical protein